MRAVVSIFVLLFTLTTAPMVPDKCKVKYHYWRPYIGEFSQDDFVGATDTLGKHTYIAKIIPTTNSRSWTVSTQLNYDYVEYAWEDAEIRRIYRFMEIMVVLPQYLYRFFWTPIRSPKDLKHVLQNKCAVQGGVLKFQNKIIYSYIGRVYVNGSFHIGTVWEDSWAMSCGLHYLNGWKKFHRSKKYQILVHEC
ncbi:uncharacterized protein LOC123312152 [Coccinella septempunctata]|uniref:uncharacterized protein LOC123312152 n=1 Tax=Coccinella septempunctata TaxID=41139 RepID=UPI001D08404F|nr:uncharacterized protein LOC123312152 [Coccinella septempunctata]